MGGGFAKGGFVVQLREGNKADGLRQVDHIIICGHYDCALIDKGDGSALGGWHKYANTPFTCPFPSSCGPNTYGHTGTSQSFML